VKGKSRGEASPKGTEDGRRDKVEAQYTINTRTRQRPSLGRVARSHNERGRLPAKKNSEYYLDRDHG